MSLAAVLSPVFVLVALAFLLLLWMGRVRYAAVGRKEVRVRDIALGEKSWPPRVQQIANAFHNQLELPIFYYALVAFALIAGKADLAFVAMSWLFVASRLVHAAVHVTSNDVRWRGPAYIVGFIVLAGMWIRFALSILIAP